MSATTQNLNSANEPGKAVLAIFDKLIERIKQSQPVRTDGKRLGGGFVYSMLTLGQPVDPQDYMNPWTPQGDTNVKDAVTAGALPAAPAAPPTPAATPTAASAGGTVAVPPPPDPKSALALAAAFKTSVLATNLLQVTTDGTYLPYPTGQHLDFQYDGILMAMQPAVPNEAPDPKVEAAVLAARKVLFKLNDDGTFSTKHTKAYDNYFDNTQAYGQAVAAFADAYAAARNDPSLLQVWPVASRPYQDAVDQAKDTLISAGGPEVEAALDTLASVGNPIQAHMIAQARAIYDEWNLGMAGAVPAKMPYSFILPTGWADPDDKDGWQHLTVTANSYQHVDLSHATQQGQYSWMNKQSTSSGGGAVSFGFGVIGGGGSSSSSSGQSQGSHQTVNFNTFHNSAKNLTVSIWYALVEIQRPWLMSDLFYMDNWYLKGYQKGHISSGKIADQVDSTVHSLPMIPKQLLLIKDVKIRTSEWGSDGAVLKTAYGTHQDSDSSHASSEDVAGGICLGPISFGGSASHSESEAQGQGSHFNAQDSSGYFGTTFDGETLCIPGAQIVAWLSDIVPLCPPLDDPEFGKTAPAPAASTVPQPAHA